MQPILPRVRRPVVREDASRYLLFTLLSFASSVSLTRLFLELTGYPQLGKGELHIAHVLWGGLLLFISALLPLIWVNRWALILDSVLAGAGVGLFIDEVGKFITSTNNYFYPAAAPIIYAFFLLTVLVYLQIRRPHRQDTRTELYAILEDMGEVLDQDLSNNERQRMLERLDNIEINSENSDLGRLVKELRDFIASDTLYLVPQRPDFIEVAQKKFNELEDKWINRRGLQAAISGMVFAIGLWTLGFPLMVLINLHSPGNLQNLLGDLVKSGLIHTTTSLFWFEARLGLQTSVGLVLLTGSGLLVFSKDRLGISLSFLGLLLSLTMVNLLMFYFDQFSTIVAAIFQFLVLMGVIYYRRRFFRQVV